LDPCLEMREYFSHGCFQKLFAAINKKYRSLGRVGGTIRMHGLSPEERDLLTGFLGRDCREQSRITIKLQDVDKILQQSRFALPLPEFLSFYFDAEILSKKEAALLETREWETFFAGLEEQACTAVTRDWLAKLAAGEGAGYRTFLALYRQNKPETAELLKICLAALDRLAKHPGRRQRLPVFAAVLTGDPHALDGDRPLGRLLFFGLHHLYGLFETEYGAERRKELFSRAGLEEDDLSSNVIVAGLQVRADDPREPVFVASNATASPLLLPLRFLEQPTAWLPAKLYIFENPAVFSAILDAISVCQDPCKEYRSTGIPDIIDPNVAGACNPILPDPHTTRAEIPNMTDPDIDKAVVPDLIDSAAAGVGLPILTNPAAAKNRIPKLTDLDAAKASTSNLIDPATAGIGVSALHDPAPSEIRPPALICTSGQPSVAALKLLDQLVEAGSTIYYSGDFDPSGLEIGQRLAERYGPSFNPWYFDTAIYLQASKGVKLTPEQLKKLTTQHVSWDNKLIETMLQVGQAVYQEILVEQMTKSFTK
jgi:uncharacterized protein (TIGR02679 family)